MPPPPCQHAVGEQRCEMPQGLALRGGLIAFSTLGSTGNGASRALGTAGWEAVLASPAQERRNLHQVYQETCQCHTAISTLHLPSISQRAKRRSALRGVDSLPPALPPDLLAQQLQLLVLVRQLQAGRGQTGCVFPTPASAWRPAGTGPRPTRTSRLKMADASCRDSQGEGWGGGIQEAAEPRSGTILALKRVR